jgi:hypothetical protein
MKPENPNDPSLSRVLHEWKTESPLPPQFNEQVWQRIARAELPTAHPLSLLRTWLAETFTRRAFAVSYASVLLLVGLFTGLWQGHANSARVSQTLSTRYVQMMDPYQMPRH